MTVVLQGTYAVVEFANQEGIASLLEEAVIPNISHDSMVPFKSRLLSLRNLGSSDSLTQQSTGQQCQPQTTAPINELIQRLSTEESVSERLTREATLDLDSTSSASIKYSDPLFSSFFYTHVNITLSLSRLLCKNDLGHFKR